MTRDLPVYKNRQRLPVIRSVYLHTWPLLSDLAGHGRSGRPPRPLSSASLRQRRGYAWHGHASPLQRRVQPFAPALQLRPPPLPRWKPLFSRGNWQRCSSVSQGHLNLFLVPWFSHLEYLDGYTSSQAAFSPERFNQKCLNITASMGSHMICSVTAM